MADPILYRRHSAACPQFRLGRESKPLKCKCPVWCDARTVGGIGKDYSMKTRDWERAERRARSESDPGAPVSEKKYLSEAVDSYIQEGRNLKWEESTITSRHNTLKAVLAFCKTRTPEAKYCDDLILELLRDFRGSRKARDGKSPMARSTMMKELENLRAFGRFCVDSEWMKTNWAQKMKTPRGKEEKKLGYTDDEIKALLAACDRVTNHNEASAARGRARTRSALLVMLYTGLRISDVAVLKRADVSFKTGRWSITTVKTGAEAYGVLPRVVLDALAALPVESKEYFFWSGHGRTSSIIGSLRRGVDCVFKLAGVVGHLDKFRRTYATTLRDQGVDMRDIQAKLAHKRLSTTEGYLGETAAKRRHVESIQVTYDLDSDGVGPEVGGQNVVGDSKRNVSTLGS
jgi:integrase/recombinase XerD